MTEGVDFDRMFVIKAEQIYSVNEIEKDFLERHQDLEIVKIVDLLDDGTRFGVWAKNRKANIDK